MQLQLLKCLEALLCVFSEEISEVEYDVFVVGISILAIHRSDDIKQQVCIPLSKSF